MTLRKELLIRCFLLLMPLFSGIQVAGGVETNALKTVSPHPHYSQIAVRFAKDFPREHLTRHALDDGISSRAWEAYLSSLDYEHVYFLESDIRAFKVHKLTLDDELKSGNIDFAYTVFDVFKKRVRDRHDFLDKLLEKGFDLKKKEVFFWKRKNSPWPADSAESNEIWRKKIKNEYVQIVAVRELDKEEAAASTNVVETASATGADAGRLAEGPTAQEQVGEQEDVTEDTASQPAAPVKKKAIVSPETSIRKRYKQARNVFNDSDAEWVLQKYLSAFARAYDPHSSYMSPSSMEDFNIEMRLSLVGIGALLRSEDGGAKIVRLIPGGPADCDKREKRLRAGDKIIGVGQGDEEPVDILHWPLHKIVRLIRGEKGTKVVLVVIPASDSTGSTTKNVDIIRDEVKLDEQAASWKLREITGEDGVARKLGVITLPAFYANMKAKSRLDPAFKSAAFDVEKLLEDMAKQNVTGVILDLRNNGGGSLLEAIRMGGLFIETGPIVQVKERYRGVRVMTNRNPAIAFSGPLIVLINRLSASASEIVAGALRDYERAILIGDSKTHGKGTVQTILDVGEDKKLGAMKITTANYYRITGSSTQLKGVSPDIVISSPLDFMELGEDYQQNAMEWTRINPARYRPVADIAPIASLLREKSKKRRSEGARFQGYNKVLKHVAMSNKEKEVSLNLDERKTRLKKERELSDLQDKLFQNSEDAAEDASEGKRDLILDECLKILSDFVALIEKSGKPFMQPAKPSARTPLNILNDWLKENL